MTHLDLPEERNHSYRHAEWKRLLHVGHASSGNCTCEEVGGVGGDDDEETKGVDGEDEEREGKEGMG